MTSRRAVKAALHQAPVSREPSSSRIISSVMTIVTSSPRVFTIKTYSSKWMYVTVGWSSVICDMAPPATSSFCYQLIIGVHLVERCHGGRPSDFSRYLGNISLHSDKKHRLSSCYVILLLQFSAKTQRYSSLRFARRCYFGASSGLGAAGRHGG